jgi:hypothetical protein
LHLHLIRSDICTTQAFTQSLMCTHCCVGVQEQDALMASLARIAALEPDLLVVEKSVARVAQEALLDQVSQRSPKAVMATSYRQLMTCMEACRAPSRHVGCEQQEQRRFL